MAEGSPGGRPGPVALLKDSLAAGWRAVAGRPGLALSVSLTHLALGVAANLVFSGLGEAERLPMGFILFSLGLSAALALVQALALLGAVGIALSLVDGGHPVYWDLFGNLRRFPRFLGTVLIGTLLVASLPAAAAALGLGVAGGNLGEIWPLFALASLLWAVHAHLLCLFAPFEVVDRGAGPFSALRGSARLTRGSRWTLLLLSLVLLLLNLAAALPLLAGLLLTVPFTLASMAHAYRTLGRTTA